MDFGVNVVLSTLKKQEFFLFLTLLSKLKIKKQNELFFEVTNLLGFLIKLSLFAHSNYIFLKKIQENLYI